MPQFNACPTNTCNRCHKKLNPADRVTVVHIIEKIGKNPHNILQEGSWFSGEFEVAHQDCANPGMHHSIVVSR